MKLLTVTTAVITMVTTMITVTTMLHRRQDDIQLPKPTAAASKRSTISVILYSNIIV